MRGFLVAVFAVTLVTACGDDDGINNLPDAPRFQDAPEIDAPTSGVVTLTVTRSTVGVEGVKVYFQNADSSLVMAATTDANGVASATMEPGGFVTAIDPFLAPLPAGVLVHDVRTFAGVKPGDQLVLSPNNSRGTSVNFTLVLPVDPNATNYVLYAPCALGIDVTDLDGSGGSQAAPGGPLSLFDCEGTTDIVVVAMQNGTPVNAIAKTNVTLTEGGTLDLSADAYVAPTDASWAWEGVPANIGSINLESFLVGAHGPVSDDFNSAIVNGGAAMTSTIKRPVVAGALQVDVSTFFGGNFGRHSVIDWGPPVAVHTTTLGNPTILVPDFTSTPTFDIANHAVTWTEDAVGTAPDFSVTDVFFNRPTASLFWDWQIVAAHGAPSVTMPVLPADDAQYNPVTDDSFNIDDLTIARVPGGYDAIRNKVLSLDGPTGLVTGTTGQVVFQDLQFAKARAKKGTKVLRPWVRDGRRPVVKSAR